MDKKLSIIRHHADASKNTSLVLKHRLWFVIGFMLMSIGMVIVIGPKHEDGPIHIHIAPDHTLTTQDFIAAIPFTLGLTSIGAGLWHNQTLIRNRIQQSPEQAFVIALLIGLAIGLVLGLGLGAVFTTAIRRFIQFISNQLDAILS